MSIITVKLPEENFKNFIIGKPIVLLGANGAGKTRLSVKIEELNDPNFNSMHNNSLLSVHRITAQKSLTLNQSLIIKGLEASEKEASIGSDYPGSTKRDNRYSGNPATHLLNDYDKVLSLFFARNNKLLENYHEFCTRAKNEGKELPPVEKSLKQHAEDIWNYLIPKRTLDLSGNEVHAFFENNRYHAKEMSDGERVILYLITQILSLKNNSLIIIDEPELHIHKAILNKLWDKLEEARQDCVFMYITHDLDFAVSRSVSEILWVKSFDGIGKWEYEFLPLNDYSDIPEGLLFELIGTQKKTIFVEGTKESLDYLIYQELYKDQNYHVIPCGGCSQVIKYVKSKKGYKSLQNIEVYGIIDRDFRPKNELDSLEKEGIFSLKVAEVENLFIVEELLAFMQERLGYNISIIEEVKSFIKNIFQGSIASQVAEAVAIEINHQLSKIKFDNKVSSEEIKLKIEMRFSEEKFKNI
ncbi:DUF4435 domain-containing protein, partial [Paenibacillus nuruki]|uniref:DUF4435 domain-containing protein n=1 Tax=Paenibacillus nuruki TaxID=1886670 RepID=UPI000846330A